MKKIYLAIILTISFAAIATNASAAGFYFEANPVADAEKENLIQLNVFLDTGKESINALEGELSIADSSLIKTMYKNSIVSIWIKNPTIEDGNVSFAGAIPGGYNSNTYEGQSTLENNNYLFSLILEDKSQSVVNASFNRNKTKVLLNDGLATELSGLSYPSPVVNIDRSKIISIDASADTEAPHSLSFEILKNAPAPEGQSIVILGAQDDQSDIAYFEIKEKGSNSWIRVESPYLSEAPENIEQLRATDKAGNSSVLNIRQSYWRGYLYTAILILGTLILFRVSKKKKYLN